jgi:fucose 4-O-acetylase-like acetyltransferase
MENKRDTYLDYAKGFAIFLIVIYHIYRSANRDNGSVIHDICHVTQLPIFFYVSGLLYARSVRGGQNFRLVNKSIRLLLPFFSFYLIWGLIDTQNFLTFPKEEFKLGYWFVLVLFEIMLLYSSLCRISCNPYSPLPHVLFYLLLTLYEVFVPKGNYVNMFFSINLLWHYYPFFLMGIYSDKIKFLMNKKYIIVYLTIFGIAFYYYFAQSKQVIASVCNVSSLLLLMTIFQHQVCPGKRIVTIMGRCSMQIYLLHFLVLKIIRPYIQVIENRWMEFIYFTLIAFAIIVFTVLISGLLEKNKWVALFLFGIKK